nr:uncharacterized protein LOC123773022 isoform X3 [Procambarus clarkii]
MASVYSSGSQISSNPSEYTDPAYDDYINSVLTDYGIRFSPGGSGIEEIEDDPSLVPSSEESREATEDKPLNLKIEVLESGQRPSAHHIATSRNFKVSEIGSDEDVGLTIDEARSPSALVTSAPAPPTSPPEPPHKKLKVYQREQPFDDPELERRRVNAILAKKNRDLKKKSGILRRRLRSCVASTSSATKLYGGLTKMSSSCEWSFRARLQRRRTWRRGSSARKTPLGNSERNSRCSGSTSTSSPAASTTTILPRSSSMPC